MSSVTAPDPSHTPAESRFVGKHRVPQDPAACVRMTALPPWRASLLARARRLRHRCRKLVRYWGVLRLVAGFPAGEERRLYEMFAAHGEAPETFPYALRYSWRKPEALWRWLKIVVPYLRHHVHDEYFFGHSSYFSDAWRVVVRGRRLNARMPLPVLDVGVDAPCDGCGARCCTVPAKGKGYSVVVVKSWEEFAQLHRRVCKPHPRTPGDLVFHFRKRRDGSLRCPFLTRDDRCGVHAHRPLACRVFSCTDGLSPCADRFPGGDFLRAVPEVKERLLRLGFEAAPAGRSHPLDRVMRPRETPAK